MSSDTDIEKSGMDLEAGENEYTDSLLPVSCHRDKYCVLLHYSCNVKSMAMHGAIYRLYQYSYTSGIQCLL